MKIIFFSLAVFITFVCAFPCRAETTIKAEADKTVITADELLTYKLSIASTEKSLPKPHLPSFDGFAIVSQAQSSTVSYRQGGMQTILVFAFILLPQKTDVLTIEPAQITVKGKTYTGDPVRITVTPGVSAAPPRVRKPVPDKKPVPPEEESFPEGISSRQPRYNL